MNDPGRWAGGATWTPCASWETPRGEIIGRGFVVGRSDLSAKYSGFDTLGAFAPIAASRRLLTVALSSKIERVLVDGGGHEGGC